MSHYVHRIAGSLGTLSNPRNDYVAVFFRDDFFTAPKLTSTPLWIDGELNEHPIKGAILWSRALGRYMIVSPDVFSSSGLRIGENVEIRFNLDDTEQVTIPDELSEALDAAPLARAAWCGLTAGRRRALAYWVGKPRVRWCGSIRLENWLSFS